MKLFHFLLSTFLTTVKTSNIHTKAGDQILAETARLVENVNLMEHEMINGGDITNKLRKTAMATGQILKKINNEENTSFKELRTAVRANCLALKRETRIGQEEGVELSDRVKKIIREASIYYSLFSKTSLGLRSV